MRSLDKIIFINSANIRYAEVRLDGNVHFIGTQGVGKSTVLRAILFFYSADKYHLGIPREKKSFDEFYLPHSNSYIIYEVRTEHGAFCVLTFRHLGRAAFRIIGAPYSQRWLVDEDGSVTGESPVIRRRLGERYMSRIIEHYDEYRDIIYGNKASTGKEFAPYWLMQSPRYQSIPRSITNVFLNSKVDADFIKDIIIRSMAEDEPGIDLAYYRRQVSEFQQEYEDISLWFRKDRQGNVPVRRKADELVDHYHRLIYLGAQVEEDVAEAHFAARVAGERIPLLEEALSALAEKESRQARLLRELADKFEKEKSSLLKDIGVREERLRTILRKRKYYAEAGIEGILRRCSAEASLRAALEEQRQKHGILTSASDDIKMKYERLEVNQRAGQQKFYQITQGRIDEIRVARVAAVERMHFERDSRKDSVRKDASRRLDELRESILSLRLEKCNLENSRGNDSSRPCATFSNLQNEIRALELEQAQAGSEVRALTAKEESLRGALVLKQHIDEVKAALRDARVRLQEHLEGSGFDHQLEQVLDEERIRREIAALEEDLAVSRADLKAVREVHERKSQLELRLGVIPGKMKALKLQCEELQAKAAEEERRRKASVEKAIGECIDRISRATAELESAEMALGKRLSVIDKEYESSERQLVAESGEQIGQLEAALKERTAQLNARLAQLERDKQAELRGRGVDMDALAACERLISEAEAELRYIDGKRETVFSYRRDCEEYFDTEDATREEKKALETRLAGLEERYGQRRAADEARLDAVRKEIADNRAESAALSDGIRNLSDFIVANASFLPKAEEKETARQCADILSELRDSLLERQQETSCLRQNVNAFRGFFSGGGRTFKFRSELVTDSDYMDFSSGLSDFLLNGKIEDYRRRVSDRYVEILGRIAREMGDVTRNGAEVEKIIREINYDFRERNFVGAIKSIELRSVASSDAMVQLLLKIKEFTEENPFASGEANLFSEASSSSDRQAVDLLLELMKHLVRDPSRTALSLSDTFTLQFRIVENDNDTMWVEKISNVGSDGTDILVKAMVNIMLINVFKDKVSRRFGDFRIHCMMDEIGKLHPSNVKGILEFANSRNILLINGSPTTYNVAEYRHTYLLSKDSRSLTLVRPLITRREEALSDDENQSF